MKWCNGKMAKWENGGWQIEKMVKWCNGEMVKWKNKNMVYIHKY